MLSLSVSVDARVEAMDWYSSHVNRDTLMLTFSVSITTEINIFFQVSMRASVLTSKLTVGVNRP